MRAFAIERAAGTAEALRLGRIEAGAQDDLAAVPRFLAGGTNLLDLMKLDVMRASVLVDINDLEAEHGGIAIRDGMLHLGGLARMAAVADHPVVRRDFPILSEALWKAASPQLRNMATLAGNVLQRTRCNYFRGRQWAGCNKRDPGSGCAAKDGVNRRLAVLGTSEQCIANYPGDFAVALAGLGAEVDILGNDGGRRSLPFEALHRLPGDTPHIETELEPGELITGFRVPIGDWTRRSLYLKIRDRESYDFALASAAVALDLGPDGTVRSARIGLGGLAAKPWRSHEAEDALAGRSLDETSAQEAAEAAFASAVPHGDAAFKLDLGRRTLVRALLAAQAMEI
ncbi:FAD binding domain-containing protein [Aureimonas leprariae]|uniref:Xanthine dehydrogenase family protein subunit M n=1 Tax=Plantimonas leprariae TaxID=2615207 RepID=A0A7V7PKC5_9HYPH|nr:xanthine dehydrogenase family protein subunit M [Aureimonas leprariae]KAB0676215.1 xanthine dehydrogenase family protein subunit M [Aureimonas leprariae]